MKSRSVFILPVLFFLSLMADPRPAHGAEDALTRARTAGTFQVKISNGYLSLEANQAPLVQILEEIRKQAGITIESNIGPEEKITTRLDRVPIEDGIRQLANNVSFFYAENPTDKTRRIERVVVLSTGSGVSGRGKASSQAEKHNQPARQQAEVNKPPPQPEPFKFEFDPGKFAKEKASKER
jgi:hypothetical protein